MTRVFRACFLALIFSLLLSSCTSHDWTKDDAFANIIKVHPILPNQIPKSDLVIEMPMTNGKTIKMDRIPLVTNKDMVHAESDYHGENAMVIKLFMTGLGRNKWHQASSQMHGSKAVMTIGGKFKCFISYDVSYNGTGPVNFYVHLSSAETDELCSLIKKNYKALVRK